MVPLHDAHIARADAVGYEPLERLVNQRDLRNAERDPLPALDRSGDHVRRKDRLAESCRCLHDGSDRRASLQ